MAKKDNKKKSGKNTPASKETTPSSSVPDLSKLKINSDRTATGVRTSTDRSRDFSFEQFSLNLCGRNLIQNTTLELNYGNRYGLVSENGAGKTTLLQCIAARDIDIPEHIDIHLLAEEAEKTDMSAIEYVIHHAQQQLEKLETELEDAIAEDPDDPLVEDLLERIEQMDSATFEPRAAMILSGLGFAPERQTQMTKDMSGGWRMRVALAKALFIKPTLLLLDQPSNHLDLPAVIWLEEYLAKYDRMLLMVSHSEDLLNAVCSHIIHLSPKKTLDYYGGNYDVFVRTKEENEVNQMKAYEKQQAEIAHIKAFAAAAGTYSNLVKQAQSKLKIVEKMEAAGLVEKVEAARQIKFNFTNAGKLPPPVLAFDDVSFAYSGKMEDCLYNDLELGIDCDSRIALVGPNG
ncbi:P-loop containing nucleoside triphosphate hydrolase protein, partial [Ramicandelaber brevisporus]